MVRIIWEQCSRASRHAKRPTVAAPTNVQVVCRRERRHRPAFTDALFPNSAIGSHRSIKRVSEDIKAFHFLCVGSVSR